MNDNQIKALLNSKRTEYAISEILGNILIIDWIDRSTLRRTLNQLIFTEKQQSDLKI